MPKRAHQRRKGDDRDREVPRYGCRSSKTGWDHRRGAESAMREAMRHGGLQAPGAPLNTIRTAYRCDTCGRWHLTSLQVEKSRAIEQRQRRARVIGDRRMDASASCTAREWKIRATAIRVQYGKAQAYRPAPDELATEAAQHYARALGIAEDPARIEEFWRAIADGDLAASVAREVRESLKIAEETA